MRCARVSGFGLQLQYPFIYDIDLQVSPIHLLPRIHCRYQSESVPTAWFKAQTNKFTSNISGQSFARVQEGQRTQLCYVTERSSDIISGVNDVPDSIFNTIKTSHPEVPTLFTLVAVFEGDPHVNDVPQNTFAPGVVDLLSHTIQPIGGDDFKSSY
ncbi:Inositol-3-phosphate synthase 1 [Marasmius tenuissimus]|nr:Inositol-3-phosphate synthase 1 [Marasmius tenuissimus]